MSYISQTIYTLTNTERDLLVQMLKDGETFVSNEEFFRPAPYDPTKRMG